MTITFGLVGYGIGGRLFHAPYIRAATDCRLAGIVVRNPDRAALAREENPGVRIYGSLAELARDGIQAVTITTPPHTRRELVLQALGEGLHVIADKPFAPSVNTAVELVEAAARASRLLNVYHNRRYDSDVVTAAGVISSGALGDITRLDLRNDQDDPATVEAGPTGGMLRDLGSHLVDQALKLLGPARAVYADLDWADLDGGRTDVGFVLTIEHTSGAHSHVSSSKRNRLTSRELRVLGSGGSYVSDYSDVQFNAIVAGRRPYVDATTWGLEDESRWGLLATSDGVEHRVPSARGDYSALYSAFARAIEAGGPGPVPGWEGTAVLSVLDAARQSAADRRLVVLDE